MKRRYDSLPSALSGNSPSDNVPCSAQQQNCMVWVILCHPPANRKEVWLLAHAQLIILKGAFLFVLFVLAFSNHSN